MLKYNTDEKEHHKSQIINTTALHLSNLIQNLNSDINNNTCTHIKDPQKLLLSLQKLNNMIGMEKIKESIAQQTAFLMNKMKNGDFSMKMLNTCLYSSPGCGKSSLGVIMAEIWHNMGFLQASLDKKNASVDIIAKLKTYDVNVLYVAFLCIYVVCHKLYYEVVRPMYESYGLPGASIIVLLCIFLILLVLAYYEDDTGEGNNSVITIANRADFVDMYIGGTAPRTKRFIEANRGKVIFLDEAYNMINGYSDNYGKESLTTINQYLSEKPDEVVFIFAGYEELLKETIFKAQPGLERRCMWHFTIDKYNGKELYEIFLQQLAKEKLELLPKDKLKICRYMTKHVDIFKNMGGDIEKLTFYVQLIIANKNNFYVGYRDVKDGMKELVANSLKEEKKLSMDDLLKKYMNS